MALTQKQLEENIAALQSQGASQDAIQSWINSTMSGGGSQGGPTPTEPSDIPWVPDSLIQGALKPIARLGVNAYQVVNATENPERYAQVAQEGVNLPYFGNTKPVGASGQTGAGGFGRDVADALGTGTEVASYLMAPLKAGAGFWATIKAAAPMSATFGAAKGMEALGEGKSAGEAGLETALNYVGATAGYGLMKGAANLFSNWGARALQSDAVQAAGGWMKGFAEKAWTSFPEAFMPQGSKEAAMSVGGIGTEQLQKNAANRAVPSLADFASATTKRTVNALKAEFDTNFNTTKNAVIDSIVPEVNNPDLAFGRYQRSLSETMGNMFRKSNTLYDDVKADLTTIDHFKLSNDALSKTPKIPTSLADLPAYTKATENMSEGFSAFTSRMSDVTKQPLTMRQVMGLWNESMGYISGANTEEKVIIRDFAAGLYADARSVLTKKNPELLNQWDTAWQAWKKAVDVYESGPLNKLKSVGDIDTFIDTMITKPLTRVEADAFKQSLGESAPAVQDLFVNSLLRKAKQLDPKEGSVLIRKFLDNYDEALLQPGQAKMLDDVAAFMDGSFDEFVLGMRKAQGLTDEAASSLLENQTKQARIQDIVGDARLDQIAQRLIKAADNPELEKTLDAFTPEEKNMIGLSIAKGLFDEKLPVAAQNADGTYKIAPEFAETLIKFGETMDNNKALQKILSPEQLKALDSAVTFAEKTKDLSEVPPAGFHRVMNGLISIFYLARGWMPGAARNAVEAAQTSGEKTLLYYGAMQDMIEQGLVTKNKRIMIGDLMKLLLPGAGQALPNTLENQ